ncbi:family 43 glycosylhydrolase [Mucilaginibacter angelicae]|uniref:Family 43 glycosylhydrolase n=1 Tax=Mucilaginibacter angelicae TaxID=869718 RepID=A0ABV6LG04_9SPHI
MISFKIHRLVIADSLVVKRWLFALLMLLSLQNASAQTRRGIKTFCNPINLPYNFQTDGVMRREAADPTIVLYQNRYWLFASKQKGYWYSADMLDWNFVKPEGLPLDVYAPSIAVVNGKLIFFGGNNTGAFTTDDPLEGKWVNINGYAPGCTDPALFQDTDGKVYLYNGCSDVNPIQYVQLDAKTFLPIGEHVPLFNSNTIKHGWEVPGDTNGEQNAKPWIEGSYMNKIGGKYYLQYAGPGTQFKTYADGVYVADKATGPFVYASYNPFSFKPTGFITGGGHSATFADKYGEYWHIATGTISVRHMFERRLVLFPTFVTGDGQLVTDTYLGDYPQYAPGTFKHNLLKKSPPWMLLSYNKKATASSVLDATGKQNFDIGNAFDEEIRTWWSAKTGNAGEWLSVDMEKVCTINAIQVNFADEGAKAEAFTTFYGYGYQYLIEASVDGKAWNILINKKKVEETPHDYTQLYRSVKARYIRITNVYSPANSLFSLSDLRVFGIAPGIKPALVKHILVARNITDRRSVHLEWDAAKGAEFYIVRYGIAPNKLYSSYQVYKNTGLDINSLNTDVDYYFTVDAVNATGITFGKAPLKKY